MGLRWWAKACGCSFGFVDLCLLRFVGFVDLVWLDDMFNC